MNHIGIDGCPIGWVSVTMKSGSFTAVDVFSTIAALWQHHQKARLLLIDMPIGLIDKGTEPRGCDQGARDVLGARRSSIFPAPVRGVLKCKTYPEACDINQKRTGKKISKQAWNIVPKIKEVDTFLRANKAAQKKMRESHPEVCFTMLNGAAPMVHPKKAPMGFLDRLQLIQEYDAKAETWLRQMAKKYPQKEVATDDVVDAMILAITAAGGARKLRTLPEKPEIDGQGLPMEIVYLES
jgi:predicted RNase H-like nuclease